MKPNFLVAGVAKCGTTSLFYYLEQHPEVCIPKKETFFFIADLYKNPSDEKRGRRDPSRIIFTQEQYNQLYDKCPRGAIGEVSTCYVHYYKHAIPRIKEMLGDPPVIIVIRQPVDRLFSGYKHFLRMEKENLSLDDALAEESHRAALRWDFMWAYKGLGFYADAIEAYQSSFSNVKVILQEDLTNNAVETMKDIFAFIGVDNNFITDTSVKYNISDPQSHNVWFKYIFANKGMKSIFKPFLKKLVTDNTKRKIMHRFRKPNLEATQKLDEETRKKLMEIYRSDIVKTQALINRDLSHWMV